GNVWFTEQSANRIGRITPAGVITEFPLPDGTFPYDITLGPDGNLWFTAVGKIVRITPAGAIKQFPLRSDIGPIGITAGPDGNLWFTETASFGTGIARMTLAGVVTEFA